MPGNIMLWSKLLDWRGLHEDRRYWFSSARSPWQIDYDRIVFSSAFRRLQDKTQVFPLSDSDYVRTRLTHSTEVSTVARTLGTRAGKFILDKHGGDEVINEGRDGKEERREVTRLDKVVFPSDFGGILAAAAAAHDLGNPPFGHSGEDAVRHWFTTSKVLDGVRERLSPEQRKDMENWEGNAQGFRILSKLQLYKQERGGMRLTHATLAAYCKYPTFSSGVDKDAHEASRHKVGIFDAEKDDFKIVAEKTGLLPGAVAGTWCRHPLAFLMEAADDVCYRVIDLEDAVRVSCIEFDAAKPLLEKIATKMPKDRLDRIPDPTDKIAYLRAASINALIDEVIAEFEKHEQGILEGKFTKALGDGIFSHGVLEEIKDLMKAKVYRNRGVLEVEAAGFQIIPGLLDLFWTAVTDGTRGKEKGMNFKASKVLALIPEEYCGPKGDSREATYERLLRITDYVSGMTDSYALGVYRKLNGITMTG